MNAENQSPVKFPRHVAIIMDGNGRWALKRNQPRVMGHREAFKAVTSVVKAAAKKKIEVLTLFAFSSENWMRPEAEVNYLMRLFLNALNNQVKKLHENNIRLRIVGDLNKFSEQIRIEAERAQELTRENTGLQLIIAANYGGQWDILNATKQIVQKVMEQTISIDDINPKLFEQYLTLSDVPYPDLLIRTSGEQRISNFFLWQLAYAELYFTDIFWPDFDEAAFDEALLAYSKRQRRFGKLAKG